MFLYSSFLWGCYEVLSGDLARQPLLQLLQRLAAVADLVLLHLLHLSICLACFCLEARVPACPFC
jgi:hypothetical protein